jgi:hypothetical protein
VPAAAGRITGLVARIKYGAFLRGSMNRALGGLVLTEPLLKRLPLVHYRRAAAAAARLAAAPGRQLPD